MTGRTRRRQDPEPDFDRELADLPDALRWREWMKRVEAVLFATAAPVPRRDLAKVVGEGASLDALIADIQADAADRAYEVRRIGDGWMMITRAAYAPSIRTAAILSVDDKPALREIDLAVLAGVATHQPVTRRALSEIFSRDLGTETFARLRARGLIAYGPRSPTVGGARSYVTTEAFLMEFGFADLGEFAELADIHDADFANLRQGD
jgi:segregation and condensation protein B